MALENKYRGWLPVLSGFISFRNASGQTIAERCRMPVVWGDLAEPDGLNVKQLRELKDDAIPSISWRPFRDRLPANTGVFIFSMRAVWADSCEKAIKGFVYARPAPLDSVCAESLDNEIPPMGGVVQDANGWVLEFSLDRSGVIDLSWGDSSQDAVLEIIDTDFYNIDASDAAARLTFQTYLFLKDFVHSHKFHNGDDDSILIPYKVSNSEDTSWYEKTARNLHASIVTSMRGGRFDIINAIGQISYLRTLMGLAETIGVNFTAFNPQSLDILLEGCQAKLERIKLVESESTSLGGIILTLLFSFVAVLIAMLQLLQIPCISAFAKGDSCSIFAVSPFALMAATFVLVNWAWSVICVYFAVLVILYIFFKRALHDVVSQRIGHRRFDWIILRPVFGTLLGDYGRTFASFWVVVFSLLILFLLWISAQASIH